MSNNPMPHILALRARVEEIVKNLGGELVSFVLVPDQRGGDNHSISVGVRVLPETVMSAQEIEETTS